MNTHYKIYITQHVCLGLVEVVLFGRIDGEVAVL
jgi:hypothetical protein